MDDGFWQGRRVLVTGHTGFKGSWLVSWLKRMGSDVAGYALTPPTVPSLFAEAEVAVGIESTIADVLDRGELARAISRHRPEVVFHLAAQSLVRASYDDPSGTFAVNVIGTVNLLDAIREAPSVRVGIVVTSDKCYENREWVWPYRETDPLGGHDPYSASKACAELVAASYRRSFFDGENGARIATVRAGNVLGGGDWSEDRLIPDIIRALAGDATLVLRYPSSVRPWQHVLDPLAGYLLAAESLWARPDLPGAWNFAPPVERGWTVERIVTRLNDLLDRRVTWTQHPGPLPHESGSLQLDASLARTLLDWAPRFSLEETLELVARWYAGHASGRPARDLIQADIDRYLGAVPT